MWEGYLSMRGAAQDMLEIRKSNSEAGLSSPSAPREGSILQVKIINKSEIWDGYLPMRGAAQDMLEIRK
jgi:hypothetical protein